MSKNLSKLDLLINDWIFDVCEPRAFSTNEDDTQFLVEFLKKEGVQVKLVVFDTYFYCEMKKDKLEVCADSRANVRPRTPQEAVCVAALKIYIEPHDQNSWNKIFRALDLNQLISDKDK